MLANVLRLGPLASRLEGIGVSGPARVEKRVAGGWRDDEGARARVCVCVCVRVDGKAEGKKKEREEDTNIFTFLKKTEEKKTGFSLG